MKQNVKITFSFLAAVIGSFCVQADDVAGLMRVESDTNGEVTVEMPFTPFGDGTIPTFLSGTFFGDGGVGSDRLWRIPKGFRKVSTPSVGDIISNGSHMGIVSTPGKTTISASSRDNAVVENDWGYRPGQHVVFWHFQ